MAGQQTSPDSSFLQNLRTVLRVMGPRRRAQLIAAFVLMFLGAMAELVTIGAILPFLAFAARADYAANISVLRWAFDGLGIDRTGNMIVPTALLLIGAAIAAAILRLSLTWVSQKFSCGLHYDIAMHLYGRIIRQPYELFVRQNSSTIISGMEKIYFVVSGVIAPILQGITSAGIALFIVAFLFMIDPFTAALASLSMGVLYVAITVITRRVALRISRRAAVVRTERIKLLQESLGGFRDVVLDHSAEVFERRLSTYENEVRRLQIYANFMTLSPRFIVESAGITLVALLAVYFSQQEGGMLGALPILGALALGAQRLLPLLQNVYLGWQGATIYEQNLRDVAELLRSPVSTARFQVRTAEAIPFTRSISLERVSFGYGSDALALDNVDLTIAKGARVGLIGTTGSGKSTLVDVLMGLLRPTSGRLVVDDAPIDDSNIVNWQAQIAHVPQAIFLADDTIAANIAFGSDGKIDIERVREAADRADILQFIDQLPDGLMTKVGERGVRLSGGQRQRIGIARALYKKATVLILDEATSALDDRTEAAVMESVTGLARDLTIIMIAHRLSTVSSCDTIYRLETGRIVEKGTYGEVVMSATR